MVVVTWAVWQLLDEEATAVAVGVWRNKFSFSLVS